MVVGLEREKERETERVLCVQSLHSQSRNNFRWRRVRERQISHDITYLWHQRNELMFSYVSKFLRRQRVPVWVLALPPPSSVILGSSKSLSCQHLRSWYILKPEGALSFWFSGTGNFYIEQSETEWLDPMHEGAAHPPSTSIFGEGWGQGEDFREHLQHVLFLC